MNRDERRLDALALLFACGAVLVFWWPLLRPFHIYPSGDLTHLFWPQRVHLWRSVAEGVIPLWNPNTWGGSPFLASMQPGVFDPTTWIAMLRSGDPVSLLIGTNLQRVLLYLILAANVFFLARRGLCMNRSGSALASIIAACCGFLWGHFDHINQTSAMAWYPLALLGALQVIRGGGLHSSLLIGVAVCLQVFAGHPQHVALGGLSVAVIGVLVMLLHGSSWRIWLRSAFLIGAGYAFGALLSGAQLLPGIELSRLSERVFDLPNYAWSFSMEPRLFLRLLLPNHWGHFPHYTIDANFSEMGVFVGRITLLLGLGAVAVAVLRFRDRAERTPLALAAMVLFAGLWSLGEFGPVFKPLIAAIPPLRSFRVPPRMLFHFDLCLALLAGWGWSLFATSLHRRGLSLRTIHISGVIVVLAVLTELMFASRHDYFRHPVSADIIPEEPEVLEYVLQGTFDQRLWRLDLNDGDYYIDPRPTALPVRIERLQPNIAQLWSIDSVDGYTEGLLPTARWRDLMEHLNRNFRQRTPDAATLGLLGVKWVLTESWIAPIEHPALQPVARHVYREGNEMRHVTLYHNDLYLPSVMPFTSLTEVADAHELDGLWSRGMAPGPLKGNQPVPVIRPEGAWPTEEEIGAFSLTRLTPNTALVINFADFVGTTCVIQGAYPGWLMRLDSRRPLEQIDQPLTIQNAVWSTWDIQPTDGKLMYLHYEPTSYRLGLFFSLIGTLILGLGSVVGRGRGRRSRRESPLPE